MVNIYSYKAGNTLDSHEKFLRKLTKKGAKEVKVPENSDAIIVFCPIVSRFETDIKSALDADLIKNRGNQKVILVAMHHTFDPDYTICRKEELSRTVNLLVECLFFEKRGLLTCRRNKEAYKMVRKELKLEKSICLDIKNKK